MTLGASLASFFITFFFLFLGSPDIAASQNRKTSFKVKNYHLKSKRSHWDSKTGILNLKGHVEILLALADQTTAYMNCDEAQENKVEATGKCWGNTHFIWQDLKVDSERSLWDIGLRKLEFHNQGILDHKNFTGGTISMLFDHAHSRLDFDDKFHFEAMNVKGVWSPFAKQP